MEMLVVLMIMGLIVGLVSAVARPDERSLLRVEADRLAQLLDIATMESQLTGKSVSWTTDGPSYRFWRIRDDGGWSEIRDSDLLRARALPQGMTISGVRADNRRAPDGVRLAFIPYSPALSFTIEMSFGATHCTIAESPLGDVRVLADD